MLPCKVHQHTGAEGRTERDFCFVTHCTQACYMLHITCHMLHVTCRTMHTISDKKLHSERLSSSLSDNMKRDVCDCNCIFIYTNISSESTYKVELFVGRIFSSIFHKDTVLYFVIQFSIWKYLLNFKAPQNSLLLPVLDCDYLPCFSSQNM